MNDVYKLMGVLDQLVDRGDTLIVIEHHPLVMAGADWLVELGPGGGEHGGRVVAQGPPARVARGSTPTAGVLRAELEAVATERRGEALGEGIGRTGPQAA